MRLSSFLLVLGLLGGGYRATAQAPPAGYSLAQALTVATARYPSLQASQLSSQAAQRQVAIARNTLIPELSVAYQANVATYNNITGMFFPQYVLPISGPPSTANRGQAVVGSAASALLTWTPLTFGARTAAIDLAQAQYRAAQASQASTLLGHQVLVADAYLDLLLNTELERVYAQNIRRTEVTAHQAAVLVTTGLRPGVDSAQFNAAVSQARVDLLTAQQNREAAAIRLSELLALPAGEVAATDTTLLTRLPPAATGTPADTAAHPDLLTARQQVEVGLLRQRVIRRAVLPQLSFWGTTYGRGSGIDYTGEVNSADGWRLSRTNYGAGVQLAVPVLSYWRVRTQAQQEQLLTQANAARRAETALQLSKQQQQAQAALRSRLLIAGQLPRQLGAARFAYRAQQLRYASGLVSVTDVAQAQYALVQAEVNTRAAAVQAWKAYLALAAARGDVAGLLRATQL
jgi:outer membrane protein